MPRAPAAAELVAVKIIDTVIVDDTRPILPKSDDLFDYPERSSPQDAHSYEEDE